MKLWRSRRAPHVVFVHAGGVDGRMWHPLAERLNGRRLHIPDLRGHGSTPLPPGEFSHAVDLLRMLNDLRIKRATLVGASFGGWVALQLATKAPERVEGLALLASTDRDRAELHGQRALGCVDALLADERVARHRLDEVAYAGAGLPDAQAEGHRAVDVVGLQQRLLLLSLIHI